jgi:hypothetical protein
LRSGINTAQIDRAVSDLFLQPQSSRFLFSSTTSETTLKFWMLALSAVAVIAARATYNLVSRHSRSGSFTSDQVSSDWLATARIHEDQG